MSFKIHHLLKLVMIRIVSLQDVAARIRVYGLLVKVRCTKTV